MRYKDLPEAAGATGVGLDSPDLCLVRVPGTRRPLDGKFLAGQAPAQQFE